MTTFAYDVPDSFRPKENLNLVKVASKPYMGITAFVANRPHLVVAFDGQEYQLEDTEGESLQLARFDWDIDNVSEENALVAASRVEGSPFEFGREIDGQVIGKLSYEDGEWSVKDDGGGDVDLLGLIEQLEAQGWEVEEMDFPNGEEDMKESSEKCALDIGEEHEEDEIWPLEDPIPRRQAEPAPERREEPAREPVKEPAKTQAFKADCENCGQPLGEHTVDGHRCPANPREREEEFEPATASFDKTTDTNGNPLRAGDFYDMHSTKYKIPDTIKLIQVSPDFIVATTHEGSVTLKIDHDELTSNGYTFEPLFPESHGDQTIESHFVEGIIKDSRKRFSQSEQQDLIDEKGVARNKSKLRLDDSHYLSSGVESDDDDLDLYFL